MRLPLLSGVNRRRNLDTALIRHLASLVPRLRRAVERAGLSAAQPGSTAQADSTAQPGSMSSGRSTGKP